jgi:hypothetical protein
VPQAIYGGREIKATARDSGLRCIGTFLGGPLRNGEVEHYRNRIFGE